MNNSTNNLTNQKTNLTVKSIYTDLLPHLPYSALKLYIHYHLVSYNHTLDLMQFCKETNTSINTAYRALKILKQQKLIPFNTTFTNTYEPEK